MANGELGDTAVCLAGWRAGGQGELASPRVWRSGGLAVGLAADMVARFKSFLANPLVCRLMRVLLGGARVFFRLAWRVRRGPAWDGVDTADDLVGGSATVRVACDRRSTD